MSDLDQLTAPLSTIILPRADAIRMVELCELAEMRPPVDFLASILPPRQNGSSSAATEETTTKSEGGAGVAAGGAEPHVLVTQMALLLYLGEYSHARHLWRRNAVPSDTPPSGDYLQLAQLWQAAKYCFLWSTGGIHALTSGAMSSPSPAPSPSGQEADSMQVEGQGASNQQDAAAAESEALPYSTMALRALHSCATSAETQPLATYSKELLGVFRQRVNRSLHKGFAKISPKDFYLRMNLDPGTADIADYGWKSVGGEYLVSDGDLPLGPDILEGLEDTKATGDEGNQIGKLTDIVMFLESKMSA